MAKTSKDGFGKAWIVSNSVEILSEYESMTVRQLYYRLVATKGYPNTMKHYKRVVSAMTSARWDGTVSFGDFIDREREPKGRTNIEQKDVDEEIESTKSLLRFAIKNYDLNRWSNQPVYPVVWIEKKALQSVFEPACSRWGVELLACKGYPSLTALNEASWRFGDAISQGKEIVIIYFGDHDPSGDDIPRSLEENLSRLGADVSLDRIALTPEQVIEMGLPPAPTKQTDSRSARWDGIGQVECDAIDPKTLQLMCQDAIDSHFNHDLYDDLMDKEKDEREKFKAEMLEYVTSGQFESDIEG